MEAISFINSTTYGTNMSDWNITEKGPVPGQIMADLEDGLWMGKQKLPPKPSMHAAFGKIACGRIFLRGFYTVLVVNRFNMITLWVYD